MGEGQVLTQTPSSSPKCTQREDMEGTGWLQCVQMLLGCHCLPLLCDKWTIDPGLKAPCPRKKGRMAGRGVRKNPSSQSNKGVNYLCSTDCFLRWVWDLCLKFIAPQLEPQGPPGSLTEFQHVSQIRQPHPGIQLRFGAHPSPDW